MRTGVLARLEPNLTVTTQVALAVTEFARASHTRGLTPSEVHFAPGERPEADFVFGLAVFESEIVRPGHVRVTTSPEVSPLVEFEADRESFEEMLASLTRLR